MSIFTWEQYQSVRGLVLGSVLKEEDISYPNIFKCFSDLTAWSIQMNFVPRVAGIVVHLEAWILKWSPRGLICFVYIFSLSFSKIQYRGCCRSLLTKLAFKVQTTTSQLTCERKNHKNWIRVWGWVIGYWLKARCDETNSLWTLSVSPAWPILTNSGPRGTSKKIFATFWDRLFC